MHSGRFYVCEMFLYYQDKANACGVQHATSACNMLNMRTQNRQKRNLPDRVTALLAAIAAAIAVSARFASRLTKFLALSPCSVHGER